jgi:NifU-like protein involved in Fe-S cluster formation
MLRVKVIYDAKYMTDGCLATMAYGGMITRLIKGKTLQEAQELTSERLIHELGGLPKDHQHCADLAIKTFRKALSQIRSGADSSHDPAKNKAVS